MKFIKRGWGMRNALKNKLYQKLRRANTRVVTERNGTTGMYGMELFWLLEGGIV